MKCISKSKIGAAVIILSLGVSASTQAKTVLKVWNVWSWYAKQLQEIADIYEKSHPGITIKYETADFDYTRPQKFFASVIAGNPPDIITVDGTQIPQWVEANMLLSLDNFMAQDRLKSTDYFVPAWRQQFYKGHQWALSIQANPCFTLFWNKDTFAQTGLDPEKFPKTLDEMDRYNTKLIRFSADGRLERTGLLPWSFYGGANSTFNWGWIFGGSFYNEDTRKVTANDPKVVKALEWMVDLAQNKYNFQKNMGFAGGVSPANLIKGTQPIMGVVPNIELDGLKKLSPKFVPGMTNQQPYPDGGVPGVSWDGGWAYGIPRNAKHKKESWEFIKWISSSAEGTKALYSRTGFLSAYKRSPVFEELSKDPRTKMIINDTLSQAKFYRPVIPATPVMMAELDGGLALVLQRKKSPKEFLDQVTEKVQKELNKITNRKR